MGKGGYHGGSTVVGRKSGWFTDTGFVPSPKPITIDKLVKTSKKDAKKARKKQAKEDAFFASIQGLPSTIGQTHKARNKKKRRKKAQARQR